MPIYDFKCDACGSVREVFLRRSDSTDDVWCHKCDCLMHKSEVQLSNFQLKGSGWYRDGYSNAKKTQ